MTRAALLRHALPSPYYFFVVIVVRYETTAAARWALLFVVRPFFNYAFAVALWTSFHVRLLAVLTRLWPAIRSGAELCSFQTRDLTVLRSVAALPLEEVEAPEPRRFARRVLRPTHRPSKGTL